METNTLLEERIYETGKITPAEIARVQYKELTLKEISQLNKTLRYSKSA